MHQSWASDCSQSGGPVKSRLFCRATIWVFVKPAGEYVAHPAIVLKLLVVNVGQARYQALKIQM